MVYTICFFVLATFFNPRLCCCCVSASHLSLKTLFSPNFPLQKFNFLQLVLCKQQSLLLMLTSFLPFIFMYLLNDMCCCCSMGENAPFPVCQEDYSHRRPTRCRVFRGGKWKSFHEMSRSLIAIVLHPLAVKTGEMFIYMKMSQMLLYIAVSFQRCKLCCH